MRKKAWLGVQLLMLLLLLSWIQFHPFLFAISLAIIFTCLLFLIFSFLKHRGMRWKITGFGILTTFAIVWTFFLWINVRCNIFDRVFIAARLPPYAQCEKYGVAVDKNSHLSVCSKDDEWWRYGFTRAVIYDSSGQIERSDNSRDEAWRHAALSLDHIVPFGIVGFEAKKVTGSYYVVTFLPSSDASSY